MKFKKNLSRVISFIFEYETVKIVSIKSIKVGLICRVIQLAILTYVIGYVIVIKKGYQKTDIGINSIISKVKGVSLTNVSNIHVWDVADYVIPPQENNAFFITTKALITRKQKQDKCAENSDIKDAKCSSDADCIPFQPILLGDGVKTGKCLNNDTCEVYAWCPVENPKTDIQPMLNNVFNFTVFIKNNIDFRVFKKSTSNIPLRYNKTEFSNCMYDSKNDCPIFQIGTILNLAKTRYQDIVNTGATIAFMIDWDCNLDFLVEDCFPTYTFKRLDSENSEVSRGWNFRYANYYYINQTQYRDLIKAYGIRFILSVTSKGGKFDIVPLTMNLGSGLALLGITTLICDFIVLYILNNRQNYLDAKYHHVAGEDAFHPLESENENNKNMYDHYESNVND